MIDRGFGGNPMPQGAEREDHEESEQESDRSDEVEGDQDN